MTFSDPSDYEALNLNDEVEFENIKDVLDGGRGLEASVNGPKIKVDYSLTKRQKEILFAGGLLNWIKTNSK